MYAYPEQGRLVVAFTVALLPADSMTLLRREPARVGRLWPTKPYLVSCRRTDAVLEANRKALNSKIGASTSVSATIHSPGILGMVIEIVNIFSLHIFLLAGYSSNNTMERHTGLDNPLTRC